MCPAWLYCGFSPKILHSYSLGHLSTGKLLYTFCGGLAYGYIHTKTGKMRWNIALHMSINLLAVLLDCWYGLYLLIVISVLYVPVYLIRKKPWRNLTAGESGLSASAKVKACLTSVPFWICVIIYMAIIVFWG